MEILSIALFVASGIIIGISIANIQRLCVAKKLLKELDLNAPEAEKILNTISKFTY